jgi:hypothetical protein
VRDLRGFEKINLGAELYWIIHEEEGYGDGTKIQITANHGKSMMMLKGLLFITAKFTWEEDNLVVFSSEGIDHYAQGYMKTHDCSDVKHTHNIISGYQFNPIYDPKDQTKIVGTRTFIAS